MMRSMVAIVVGCAVMAAPALGFADSGAEAKADAVLEALELPEVAQQLRDAGVEEGELGEALGVLRQQEEADDESEVSSVRNAARVLRAEAKQAEEHGPIDNFGEFVQEQIDDGVQGRDLAESIRAERQRRGGPPAEDAQDDRPSDPPGLRDRDRRRGDGSDRPRERRRERQHAPDRPDRPEGVDRPSRRQGDSSDRPRRRGSERGADRPQREDEARDRPRRRRGADRDSDDDGDSQRPGDLN